MGSLVQSVVADSLVEDFEGALSGTVYNPSAAPGDDMMICTRGL